MSTECYAATWAHQHMGVIFSGSPRDTPLVVLSNSRQDRTSTHAISRQRLGQRSTVLFGADALSRAILG
jgi:hypothetical protein